jgi:hypothetical protein
MRRRAENCWEEQSTSKLFEIGKVIKGCRSVGIQERTAGDSASHEAVPETRHVPDFGRGLASVLSQCVTTELNDN